MERLTYRLMMSDREPMTIHGLTELGEITCGEYCADHESCRNCAVQRAIDRLAAYEDTGFEPDEIAARDEHIKGVITERLKELKRTLEELPSGFDKLNTLAAVDELTKIYARIFGIPYDKAEKEPRDVLSRKAV